VVTARFENAREMPAYEYVNRRALVDRCSAAADEHLKAVDVVVMPTVAITPPRLSEVSAVDGYKEANLMALRNTSIGNMLTLCGLTIPVALDAAGMPVGLQLLARRDHEHHLLAIGRAFERRLGTARERLGVAPLCR
jgi:aspartyl-tRNA(Asn)/glutamyl-tRNA(Gln) amidotransferase subunit A